MRLAFIEVWKEVWPVEFLCEIMKVTSRGFRAWRVRPMSQGQRDDMVILAHIREQHRLSLQSYGRLRQYRFAAHRCPATKHHIDILHAQQFAGFSANSGQSDAGSTTTASSCLPKPPLAFCSSISISMMSLSVVSEIAMVPESGCKTPILMVSAAATGKARVAASASPVKVDMRVVLVWSCNLNVALAWRPDRGPVRLVLTHTYSQNLYQAGSATSLRVINSILAPPKCAGLGWLAKLLCRRGTRLCKFRR
ncbi:MAG: hypothetical protein ACI92Z_001970 [Paracoccaceae bacterium]|jgi:hypothetical protein